MHTGRKFRYTHMHTRTHTHVSVYECVQYMHILSFAQYSAWWGACQFACKELWNFDEGRSKRENITNVLFMISSFPLSHFLLHHHVVSWFLEKLRGGGGFSINNLKAEVAFLFSVGSHYAACEGHKLHIYPTDISSTSVLSSFCLSTDVFTPRVSCPPAFLLYRNVQVGNLATYFKI